MQLEKDQLRQIQQTREGELHTLKMQLTESQSKQESARLQCAQLEAQREEQDKIRLELIAENSQLTADADIKSAKSVDLYRQLRQTDLL